MDNFIISKDIDTNRKNISEIFSVDKNFDILQKNMIIGRRRATLYFIDGFVKDAVLEKMLEFLYSRKEEDMPQYKDEICEYILPYGEADILTTKKEIVKNLLSGVTLLIIDGYDAVYGIDCRQYPARDVAEPEKNKSLRGSRDGFVETLVFNTGLIRRRIRDTNLTMEMLEAGSLSKTDIVICYMSDKVNTRLLKNIKEKIQNINLESLTMNQESLAEAIYKGNWLNPFPKFKYSERPDSTAASILEGNIVILVDNAPSAMIIPSSVFDIIEEADDYYFPPVTGTYLRLSRIITNIIAVLLPPTWLLLMSENYILPEWLEYIKVKEVINVPLLFQFLILEFMLDGLRLAAVNTPNMLSTPLSVIAAVVIGDSAVSSGWFNAEVMLYMAFVALANYTQPSYELGYAIKFMRIILLISTALFGMTGYIGGIIFIVVVISFNKTIDNTSYIYPLIPFNAKELCRRLLRIDLKKSK